MFSLFKITKSGKCSLKMQQNPQLSGFKNLEERNKAENLILQWSSRKQYICFIKIYIVESTNYSVLSLQERSLERRILPVLQNSASITIV